MQSKWMTDPAVFSLLGSLGLSVCPVAEMLVVVVDTAGALGIPSWAFLLPVSVWLGPPTVGAGPLGVSFVLLMGGLQGSHDVPVHCCLAELGALLGHSQLLSCSKV